ncbi:MAG: hypothetical protein HY343_03140 [Lentisphaerae bacterium]|nr:hypothetical protein [Lentisphaerota bacterium]
MQTHTVKRFFPDSEEAIAHQTGAQLSTPTRGVEVLLHTRENEQIPCCAEVISGEHYAEIGLWFEGNELSDFDGVFFLPREIGEMLTEAGYSVPKECFG